MERSLWNLQQAWALADQFRRFSTDKKNNKSDITKSGGITKIKLFTKWQVTEPKFLFRRWGHGISWQMCWSRQLHS